MQNDEALIDEFSYDQQFFEQQENLTIEQIIQNEENTLAIGQQQQTVQLDNQETTTLMDIVNNNQKVLKQKQINYKHQKSYSLVSNFITLSNLITFKFAFTYLNEINYLNFDNYLKKLSQKYFFRQIGFIKIINERNTLNDLKLQIPNKKIIDLNIFA